MVDSAEKILFKQLPRYFRPILEFQEIIKAQGYALDHLDADALRIWNNNYIPTCDEDTVIFWEGILEISYYPEDTLQDRKKKILQKLNTFVPFTIDFFKSQLDLMFGVDGYELAVDSVNCTVSIRVKSDRYGALDMLYDLLWDILPAHLEIIADQRTEKDLKGCLYTAGILSRTQIQTVHYQNITDFPVSVAIAGAVSTTTLQTI